MIGILITIKMKGVVNHVLLEPSWSFFMNVRSSIPVIIFNMWTAIIQNVTGCNSEKDGTCPTINFGQITIRTQSEDILKYLQFSQATDPNKEIPEFLDALNNNSNEVKPPGLTRWDWEFRWDWEYGEIISTKSKG